MHYRIDVGGGSYLGLCDCGARTDTRTTRRAAMEDLRSHELRAHPGHLDVAKHL